MTLRQQEILAVLRCERESKWTMSELAKELDISAAATSKMLSRLERQGKIQRFVDPDDRRYRVIQVIDEEEKAIMNKKEYQLLQKKASKSAYKTFFVPLQSLETKETEHVRKWSFLQTHDEPKAE